MGWGKLIFYVLLQYDTTVAKVERSVNDREWNVTTRNNDVAETASFDVVFVCNGHFSKPRIPSWASKLEISKIHSHDYRKASTYKDMVVAIVGAGPSGVDIALQVGKFAKMVFAFDFYLHIYYAVFRSIYVTMLTKPLK